MNVATIASNPDLVNFVVQNLIALAPPMVAIFVAEQFIKAMANRVTTKIPVVVWELLPIPLGILYMVLVPMHGKTLERIILWGIGYGVLNERLYVYVFNPLLQKWKNKNAIQDPADSVKKDGQ